MRAIPNLLTFLRVLLVPVMVVLVVGGFMRISLFLFVLSAITDYMDGFVARRYSGVTGMGTLLDPIADKVLTSALLISLSYVKMCDPYSVVLIVAREQAVTGLRAVAASKGVIIPADRLGKVKTFLIMASILILLAGFRTAGEFMVILSALVALVSGVNYFLKYVGEV